MKKPHQGIITRKWCSRNQELGVLTDAEMPNNIKAEKYSLEVTFVRAIFVEFRKSDCSGEKIIMMRVESFKKCSTVKIMNEESPACLSIALKKPVDTKCQGSRVEEE